MGKYAKKTSYKKHLKQEKAKVKLKVSHKTTLSKGQNVTKTDFKVKKIVLKDQLKLHNENEIVSKNNLNVQELLSRLNHHNIAMRNSALHGLTEVISTHGLSHCIRHLPALLESVCRLLLDIEADIRSNTAKLLTLVLSQVTEDQIMPLFTIIIKYLACSMSHINGEIRESSLIVLDTLIAKNSRLTAIHCESNILPAFLDLVSIKFNNSDRKLNLHHSHRITTSAWRVKVLSRLYSLMNAIVENNVSIETDAVNVKDFSKHFNYCDEKPLYASLYSNQYILSTALNITNVEVNNSSINSVTKTQEYIGLLVPLLLDIFIEAAPGKQTDKNGYVLSTEAAILLKYITNIILLAWKILSASNNPAFLKDWFLSEFSKPTIENLINDKFPYSQPEIINNESTSENKKSQRKKKRSNTWLNELSNNSSTDTNCTEENINLVRIYLILNKTDKNSNTINNKMSDFLIDTLKTCNDIRSKSVVETVMTCVDCLFASRSEYHRNFRLNYIVKIIKDVYYEATSRNNDYLIDRIFEFLSGIVVDWKMTSYSKLSAVQNWIDDLPKLLIAKKISFNKVTAIANIARCNIQKFIDSLDGYIEEILDSLPTLTILTCNDAEKMEGKKIVANLLYFVKTWDEEFVDKLKKAIENNYFGILTDHINNIVKIQLETPSNEDSIDNL